MIEILVKVAQFFLSLSILVIVHEFGHFIFARIFKCRVEKFYLFFDFGFRFFKTKKGETEYGIGWLPLGGYVKIAGMIDESMDREQMKQPPQPWEFRSKPALQRLMIMIAGVLMNFIMAIVIYVGVLYTWGEEYLPTANVKYGIEASDVAKEIGFMNGDKILSVDNMPVEDFYNIIPTIALENAKTVQVERDGQKVNVEISQEDIAKMLKAKKLLGVRYPFHVVVNSFAKESPAKNAGILKGDEVIMVNNQTFEYHDQFSSLLKENSGKQLIFKVKRGNDSIDVPVTLTADGMLGISWDPGFAKLFQFKTIKYGFFESIPAGIAMGWKTSVDYLKQFKLIFNKTTKGYESLGGFISIGNIFPGIWDWHSFWNMTAFLSIILAIMNILPIPALDGGHVLFVLYEIITGRKPSDKFLEYAQIVGLSLLLLLVLYANANDIIRFIIK
ncbi:MAG TPA: RIP metalloprotease RseP [Prolixibacteraceae bacterium]|nr:RIP metalloprotease RseP [Prolixibacteraceae bacterium]